MPLFQPVAHTLRHCRAIHVKAVGRGVGLWLGDGSSSGRRALVGRSEAITPAGRALIGLNLVSVVPTIPAFDSLDSLGGLDSRAQAAHFNARANRTSITQLRGSLPLSSGSTIPVDAPQHREAPCCAGNVGDLTAYADSEAEASFQLNRCHTWRPNGASVRQFYPRGYGRAPRSQRAARASRAGNEVQFNSQT